MPIETATLDAIARTYVEPMTSIRGRRVHRLLAHPSFAGIAGSLTILGADFSPADQSHIAAVLRKLGA
jgi:hypothetical protein